MQTVETKPRFYLIITFFLFQSFTGSALAALVKGLPEALQRQYEYEDPIVRGGKQLLHSPFFKVCEYSCVDIEFLTDVMY